MKSAASFESWLPLLNDRDPEAVEQVFLHVAPSLRAMVRRYVTGALRAKFDSEDVVLSVWVELIDGFRQGRWHFENVSQLRAFLITATRRKLIDQVRQCRAQIAHECVLPPEVDPTLFAGRATRPSEAARSNELWEQLLTLCPPAHHELLNLKRQGFSLDEIAERTGLHSSSVRRILYDLAKRLAIAQRRHTGP
jgi:RNA polymerase sigma-70 factor (ECF subfamily)